MAQLMLPQYRMNATGQDLERDRIVRRMYGQYNIRGGWFYGPRTAQGIGMGATPTLDSSVQGNELDGTQVSMNTRYYATQSTAQQLAQSLGGTVVIDPTSTSFNTSAPMYAIQLPDGTTVNAGLITEQLNSVTPGQTSKVQSGEIAKLLGSAYDPNLASNLLNGGQVSLAPAPAPSATPTDVLSQSQYSAWQNANAQFRSGQDQASADTNKPNQSVAPTTQLTPAASTGISRTVLGLKDQMSGGDSVQAPAADNTALYIIAGLAALMFLGKGKG